MYKTVNGKYNAVIEQVAECHAKGQPVLVGTVSVEKSEALSKLLKKKGIEHNVLNAKQHEREAEIVAQAGKQGAVTIATNMAGRGTDIMLGGNVSYMAKAALRKELSRDLTKDLAQLKDEYEHAKARAKAAGTELPTPPEETIDAQLEHLMTECDGHAETEDDADSACARQRFEELCEEFEPEIVARGGRGARGRRPVHHRYRAPRVPPYRQPAARPCRPSGRPRCVPLLPQPGG